MQAAVYQSDGSNLSPQQRLNVLSAVLQEYSSLDLIVCPELFLSGYNAGENLPVYAEAENGPMAGKIAQLAQKTQTAIVYGYPERDGDTLYNAANCFSTNGQLLAKHRKLLLPPGFESEYFTTGQGFTLFEVAGLRCGMIICYDVEYPESVRALTAAGAQVIIVPTALGEQWGCVANQLIPTRAFENGVWIIYANHAGCENGIQYLGASCIAAPDGSDAARAGSGEQVIYAELNAESVTAAQSRLPYIARYQEMLEQLKNASS